MASFSVPASPQQMDAKLLECLEAHVIAQMTAEALVVLVHAGNSDYIRFMHKLASQFLMRKQRVYIFDYHRRIKLVYLRQLLRQHASDKAKPETFLTLRVILDEAHALNELVRLQRITPSTKRPPVLIMVDPSGLFGRQRGGVKQSAQALEFQYEAAQLFAQKGYAVLLTDFGGRQFHRIESIVPSQLANSASLVLQFLPRKIVIA
jgi:hypothetical protein